jgi:hypothetical protein
MRVTSPLRTARRGALAHWPWFVPAVIGTFIYATHGSFLERAVSGLLVFTVVLMASRRPDRSLLILIVGLPFQGFVLAQLYAWGLSPALVRPLSAWKETLALGVVVAGVRGFRASGRRLDRLDLLGLAYVGIIGAYALLPELFAPGAPTGAGVRALGFRATAGFVILLLAARHARLPHDFATRAARVVMIVGSIVAAIAVYEYFFSDSWNSFVVDRVQYIRYQVDILDVRPFHFTDIRRYGHIGGREVVRVGSVFVDHIPFAFYLLFPFAVAVERTLRAGLRSGAGAALLLTATALLLTQTRSALIGALGIAFLAASPGTGRTTNRRVQFGLIFAAGLIVALPAASATGLSERATTAASGEEESAIDHVESFWKGVHAISAEPLGHGLGTSAGVGQRFAPGQTTVSENNYLQVGIETGVIAMAVFLALTVVLIRHLNKAAWTVADLGSSAARSAAIGLAIGALFLQMWNHFAVAWTFWAIAGAAIGIANRRRLEAVVAT